MTRHAWRCACTFEVGNGRRNCPPCPRVRTSTLEGFRIKNTPADQLCEEPFSAPHRPRCARLPAVRRRGRRRWLGTAGVRHALQAAARAHWPIHVLALVEWQGSDSTKAQELGLPCINVVGTLSPRLQHGRSSWQDGRGGMFTCEGKCVCTKVCDTG